MGGPAERLDRADTQALVGGRQTIIDVVTNPVIDLNDARPGGHWNSHAKRDEQQTGECLTHHGNIRSTSVQFVEEVGRDHHPSFPDDVGPARGTS